jgi:isoamylase
MVQGGDEVSRTQNGNNNAYCQDNEITWLDWHWDNRKKNLLKYVTRLIAFRHEHPVFQRRNFFQGRPIRGSNIKDIMWLRADGQEMSDEDWNSSWIRCFGIFLSGEIPGEVNEQGLPFRDDSMLMIFNSHFERIAFIVPDHLPHSTWNLEFDTHRPEIEKPENYKSGDSLNIWGHSLVLLSCPCHSKPAAATPESE